MKQTLTVLLTVFVLTAFSQTQDTIFYKDGTLRTCEIIKMSNENIKYKVYDDSTSYFVNGKTSNIERLYYNNQYIILSDTTNISNINQKNSIKNNPDRYIYSSGQHLRNASTNIALMLVFSGIGTGIMLASENQNTIKYTSIATGIAVLSQWILLSVNLSKAGKDQQNYYKYKLEPSSSGIGIKVTF